jgi:hypothetical protein
MKQSIEASIEKLRSSIDEAEEKIIELKGLPPSEKSVVKPSNKKTKKYGLARKLVMYGLLCCILWPIFVFIVFVLAAFLG